MSPTPESLVAVDVSVVMGSDELMRHEVLNGWLSEGELEGFKSFQA